MTVYEELLHTYADALLSHQVKGAGPMLDGGFLCPACKMIHGRSPDAVYPLVLVAARTGEGKYLDAARAAFAFGETMQCGDGSLYNDAQNTWRCTTVFHAIAVAEALRAGEKILTAADKQAFRARLSAMGEWLYRHLDEHTYANINYPATNAAALAILGHDLGRPAYLSQAKHLADYALARVTENGFLYGEGKPHDTLTPRHCRAIDVGYNMEESIPALIKYGKECGDEEALSRLTDVLRRQLPLMLPDGAWDNSFGCRNNKWTYYGSRTSDGCAPGFLILADRDPRFAEAAWRNTALLRACTHDGLLYGGPHYRQHGTPPCIHHTFEHANALAYAVEHIAPPYLDPVRVALPSDDAPALVHYPEVDTYRAAAGDFRATVTAYDHQAEPGNHASGGTLTLLWHRTRGPLIAAAVTDYRLVEPFNMQQPNDIASHRPLSPRLVKDGATTVYYITPTVTADASAGRVEIRAVTGLANGKNIPLPDLSPTVTYTLTEAGMAVSWKGAAGCAFLLPLIAGQMRVLRGRVTGEEKIFCLTPGFEATEYTVLPDGEGEIAIFISA